MKLSWIGYTVLVIATMGILLILFGVSAPEGLSFLDPYDLSENLISLLTIIVTINVVIMLKQCLHERLVWILFFSIAVMNLVANILDIPSFASNTTLESIVPVLFLSSLIGLVLALLFAIKHMQLVSKLKNNVVKSVIVSLVVLSVVFTFFVLKFANQGLLNVKVLVFISLDILTFILANILLSVSYKSELFVVYSFMAFGSLFLVISNVVTISLLLSGVSSSSYIGIFWIISIGMYALGSDVRLQMGTN
ncbi:MAG: hypothetical protein KAH30_07230 [Caldisericia bacterium]|nr:hypothetical protein [Caldisericia bacterium]